MSIVYIKIKIIDQHLLVLLLIGLFISFLVIILVNESSKTRCATQAVNKTNVSYEWEPILFT